MSFQLYECATCPARFSYHEQLVIHMREAKHWPTCKFCGKTFPTAQGRIHHIQAMGHQMPSFRCGTCGKTFEAEAGRDQHMRDKGHNGPTIECPGCERMFYSQRSLEQHQEAKDH